MRKEQEKELQLKAAELRIKTVKLIIDGKGGHIGGDLSEMDILVNLYDFMKHNPQNPQWEERDYFVLSKGHSAEAYYILLNDYGYISDELLATFGTFGSSLGGHPTKKIPGVEANTGALGHGLGLSAGMALALKMDGKKNHVYCLTGDGELAEGSNWEAAMSAAKYGLSNLTWIVDRNHLQISGNTEDVMPLEDLQKKAESFGFHTLVINGHDMQQIRGALSERSENKPVCVIANTVKGKGLFCAENKADWHHKTPTPEQYEQMKEEMEEYRKELA